MATHNIAREPARGSKLSRASLHRRKNGDVFIGRLEGIPRSLIDRLPAKAGIRESSIDHLLAIIRRDKTATVYVNEVEFVGTVRAKGAINKGEHVTRDKILDVTSLDITGVDIPADAGFLLIFVHWVEKGIVFSTSLH